MEIGIIGGGASGMTAAIFAAENRRNQVYLLERQARLGRKLQATGNGRCNLTNLNTFQGNYFGTTPEFAQVALTSFPSEETRRWFRSLGLFTVAEPSGRVYPYSDQANSVSDILRFALEQPNIHVITGAEVEKVRRDGGAFVAIGGGATYRFDRLVIACGGLAGTRLGGGLSGYTLLRSLGHHMTKLRPSLVQLKSGWGGIVALKGVRANCSAAIVHDGCVTAQSTGEIQFTEYGLSGPVIFELSRDVCQGGGQWLCRLDLLPDVPEEVLSAELLRRRDTGLRTDDLLTGILHNRLGRVLTKVAGIPGGRDIREEPVQALMAVSKTVKCFEIPLTEPMGMDAAQVTAGGAVTSEFYAETMGSRIVPGLYACGEVLDIDGACGGFNLQWAWSSGRLAGIHAGEGDCDDSHT